MARLPELARENMTPDQQRVSDDIAGGPRGAVRGPFHALLYSPPLADAAQKLGQYVRYDCSIPQKLRELAILITAYHWKAQYEWFAHEGHARDAGEEQVGAQDVARIRPEHLLRQRIQLRNLLAPTEDARQNQARKRDAKLRCASIEYEIVHHQVTFASQEHR